MSTGVSTMSKGRIQRYVNSGLRASLHLLHRKAASQLRERIGEEKVNQALRALRTDCSAPALGESMLLHTHLSREATGINAHPAESQCFARADLSARARARGGALSLGTGHRLLRLFNEPSEQGCASSHDLSK